MSAKDEEIIVPVEIKFHKSDIEEIIVTALEGGIGYWACLDNTTDLFTRTKAANPRKTTSEVAATILFDGGTLVFYDAEDDSSDAWNLTLEHLIA